MILLKIISTVVSGMCAGTAVRSFIKGDISTGVILLSLMILTGFWVYLK